MGENWNGDVGRELEWRCRENGNGDEVLNWEWELDENGNDSTGMADSTRRLLSSDSLASFESWVYATVLEPTKVLTMTEARWHRQHRSKLTI